MSRTKITHRLPLLALSALALPALFGGACAGMKPKPVVPATTAHAPTDTNPFDGARMYVNPDYAKTVTALAAKHPADAELLKKMAAIPTAIWLSWIADTKDLPRYLDDALAQQKAGGQPVVSTFVVYDLPNRDCNAAASAGELPANEDGEARYQRDYIDVIATTFAAHPDSAHRRHPRTRLAREPGHEHPEPQVPGGRGHLQARYRLRDRAPVPAERVHLPRRRALDVAGLAAQPGQGRTPVQGGAGHGGGRRSRAGSR